MVSILVRRRGQAIKCTPRRGTRLIVLQLFEKRGFFDSVREARVVRTSWFRDGLRDRVYHQQKTEFARLIST